MAIGYYSVEHSYLHIESTIRYGVQLICIVIVAVREWHSADREYREHLFGVKL